jgi:hypothetical protein
VRSATKGQGVQRKKQEKRESVCVRRCLLRQTGMDIGEERAQREWISFSCFETDR